MCPSTNSTITSHLKIERGLKIFLMLIRVNTGITEMYGMQGANNV